MTMTHSLTSLLTEDLEHIGLSGIELGIIILLVVEFVLIFFGDEWTDKNKLKWYLLKTITTMLIICNACASESLLVGILGVFLIAMFIFDSIFTIIDFKNSKK